MIMNNKGNVGQVVTFMMILTVTAFTIIMVAYVVGQFNSAFDDSGLSNAAIDAVQDDMMSSIYFLDYGMLILSVVLIIGLMITSFFIPTHPIFLAVNILGVFFLVFIGMVFTNVYGEFVAGEGAVSSGIAAVADNFVLTNGIINYLPFLGAFVIFIVTVVMFAKGQGGNY